MLLTTGGHLWLLSTPNAQEGYFYRAYTDPAMKFKTFHVSSEEVAEARPEPQRSIMLGYLAREKLRMSVVEYSQQYLAMFQEELGQLFKDDLVISRQVLERKQGVNPYSSYFLGVDVARMGGDESTFMVFERKENKFFHRESVVQRYTLTTETLDKIHELDSKFNFKGIYVDSGGLGVAISDQLLNDSRTRTKVVEINNASRSVTFDDKRRRRLLKVQGK